MNKVIFFDVDTQYDFMKADGRLYVPGAESIIPNLAQLTLFARHHGVRVLGDVDWHLSLNPEISKNPDFIETFPEHCIQKTKGAEKIPETLPQNPLWIDREKYLWKELERKVKAHTGEIYFRKDNIDCFSNPNLVPVLEMLEPTELVVYGVALDFCVARAVEGLLNLKRYRVTLVGDAIKPISEERSIGLIQGWKNRGVRVFKTEEVMKTF